jgi:transcriptional regulator with XRE-family HTH domain
MALGVDSLLASVGDCLRAAREQQGLTLEQAAQLSGISKSHLSRLESSERQPSVASLVALSAAYGVPVGAFFDEPGGDAPLMVSPADQPRRQSNGLSIATCSGYTGSSVIDAFRVTVPSGRPSPVPTRHPGEEWLYVLSGTLSLELDGELHRVPAGTAAHFSAEHPHRLRAEGSTAEILLVAAKPGRSLHNIH